MGSRLNIQQLVMLANVNTRRETSQCQVEEAGGCRGKVMVEC